MNRINLSSIIEKAKIKIQSLGWKLWQIIQPKVERYRPGAMVVWSKIEAFSAWIFALTDHTALRNVRVLFRVSITFLVIFFVGYLLQD